MELQRKLDAIRDKLKIVDSCTWSDPGFRGEDRIAENDQIGSRAINTTDDVVMFKENDVFENNSEWLGKVVSEQEIADENDETILLQPVETKKKGVKHRVKKILRCCTPCIKSKVV